MRNDDNLPDITLAVLILLTLVVVIMVLWR